MVHSSASIEAPRSRRIVPSAVTTTIASSIAISEPIAVRARTQLLADLVLRSCMMSFLRSQNGAEGRADWTRPYSRAGSGVMDVGDVAEHRLELRERRDTLDIRSHFGILAHGLDVFRAAPL